MSDTRYAAALVLAGCAAARSDAGAEEQGAAPEIVALVRAQEAAWNAGDIARFMELGYWRSPELTFFSGGEDARGFDAMLARYVAKYASGGAERGHLAFTRLEVVPLAPGVALARGRWDLDFEQAPDVGGLFTLALRRMDGGWRIVHDHTSVDG